MRLDLFLRASRLCPRRTIAQKLCEAGLVLVGDRKAKPAQAINPGDEITISRRNRITRIRVKDVPASKQTSRKEAGSLFEVLHDEVLEHEHYEF
jgi:ribosomal 50S subunit-recycling heat shock protein